MRGENEYSNVGFSTAFPEHSKTTNGKIKGELNEIANMVSQKVEEQEAENGYCESESIILPVKGYNIPFCCLPIRGDELLQRRAGCRRTRVKN